MGLDTDRFEGDVNEGLLCCVCKDVLEDPLQAPCEHAFCRTCIRGWLVNECTCPEDRRPLFESDLRPLHRYMRNDLDRLRIHCQFSAQGCSEICSMEGLRSHENNCRYAEVTCPYATCSLSMTRRELQEHVLLCHSTVSALTGSNSQSEGAQNSDIGDQGQTHYVQMEELKTAIEVLRAEMVCKMEDQRREMETRLDMQRGHMIQREAVLHSQVDSIQTEMGRLKDRVQTILDVELDRRRELDRMSTERAELRAMVHKIQQEWREEEGRAGYKCPHCARGTTRVTHV